MWLMQLQRCGQQRKSGMTGPVNIGSGKPVAIGELALQIGAAAGAPRPDQTG